MPDPDTIQMLVEESTPWLRAWLWLLAFVIAAVVLGNLAVWLKPRSPVEKLLRRRGYGA